MESAWGPIGPVPSSSDMDPNPRPSVVNFGEDERRGYSQYAFFTSVDVDLIPKVLTLTGGTRYYHYQEYEFGTRYLGNCVNQTVCSPIYGGGNIIDPPDASYHGFRSRGNLTWHITSDIMAYYTFSQGFRPGGFNRFSSLKFGDIPTCANGATPTAGPAATACAGTKAGTGAAQYQNSYSYAPDTLTNNEIGFKTEWLDHRAAVQRFPVRHGVEERPVRLLRSHRRLRQLQLRDERPELPHQGRGDPTGHPAHRRPDGAGLELLEQLRAGATRCACR